MLRILASTLLAAAVSGQSGMRIPTAAELANAQPALVRALVDRILAMHDGDPGRASTELVRAAYEAPDHSTRYLLWRESVALAERADDLAAAHGLEASLAADFGMDPIEAGVGLLQRAASAGDTKRAARVAMLGLALARSHTTGPTEREMLAYYDVAMRAAAACDDAATFTYVSDRIAALRQERDTARILRERGSVEQERAAALAAALSRGDLAHWSDALLRELQPVLGGLGGLDPARTTTVLEPGQWLALAAAQQPLELRRALWRCARTAAILRYGGIDAAADDARQRALHDTLVDLTDRLATAAGVTRLTFGRDADRERFAFRNGDWRVQDGRLCGASRGTDNFATLRVRFAEIHAVVIRGGILSEQGLNFRCKVGDVNLLLNWEVADENHLWLNGQRHAVPGRILRPEVEHTIAIFAAARRCDVCIDGVPLWTVPLPTALHGTVSVYPALGSEIFVREILIDGEPDGIVDAPIGTLM